MICAALCPPAGRRALALLLAAIVLTGCALPAREQPGALRAEVVSRLGSPAATIALPQGERLLYSELPSGSAAYNLDFDAQGRLVRNEQVLTQTRFESIPLGTWNQTDLLNTFGRPMLTERVARFDGVIWTYRFRQLSDLRRAHVHLDPQGIVRHVMFTDEAPALDNLRNGR